MCCVATDKSPVLWLTEAESSKGQPYSAICLSDHVRMGSSSSQGPPENRDSPAIFLQKKEYNRTK